MTRRERISYRVLLIGALIAVPAFPIAGVTLSQIGRKDLAGLAALVCVAWLFAFWYMLGVRREKERQQRYDDGHAG